MFILPFNSLPVDLIQSFLMITRPAAVSHSRAEEGNLGQGVGVFFGHNFVVLVEAVTSLAPGRGGGGLELGGEVLADEGVGVEDIGFVGFLGGQEPGAAEFGHGQVPVALAERGVGVTGPEKRLGQAGDGRPGAECRGKRHPEIPLLYGKIYLSYNPQVSGVCQDASIAQCPGTPFVSA